MLIEVSLANPKPNLTNGSLVMPGKDMHDHSLWVMLRNIISYSFFPNETKLRNVSRATF